MKYKHWKVKNHFIELIRVNNKNFELEIALHLYKTHHKMNTVFLKLVCC